MQFNTWKEFFKSDNTLFGMRKHLEQQRGITSLDISEEERYQHFKARLMDEVVATSEVFWGRVDIPLKDKEAK